MSAFTVRRTVPLEATADIASIVSPQKLRIERSWAVVTAPDMVD